MDSTGVVIFGGTFDPFHQGHFEIVKSLSEEFDKVLVIPTNVSYYKNRKITDFKTRFDNVKKQLKTFSNVEVSDIERTNITQSFYDVLKIISKEYANISLALGSDEYNMLDTWKNYKEILKLVKLVVIIRPNYEINYKFIINKTINLNMNISSTQLRNLK